MTAITRLDRALLARLARAGRVQWTFHARTRAAERGFEAAGIDVVLVSGEVIEEYPNDKPFPGALLLGRVTGRPVHVVAAVDRTGRMSYVITVYEPSRQHFEDDFRTRRKPR